MEGEIELDFLLKECSPTACFHTVTETSRNPRQAAQGCVAIGRLTGLRPDAPLPHRTVSPSTPRAGGGLLSGQPPGLLPALGLRGRFNVGPETVSGVSLCHSWDLRSGQKQKESGTFSSEGHRPDSCDVTYKLQELSKSTRKATRQNEGHTSLQVPRAGAWVRAESRCSRRGHLAGWPRWQPTCRRASAAPARRHRTSRRTCPCCPS